MKKYRDVAFWLPPESHGKIQQSDHIETLEVHPDHAVVRIRRTGETLTVYRNEEVYRKLQTVH